MITPQDKELLENKGISEEQIAEQLACFEKGFPYLKLSAAASVEKGILAPDTDEQKKYLDAWEAYTQTDKVVVKFVPASGAASRMFKNLFEFLGADYDTPQTDFEKTFFEKIEKFAFYDDLNTACQRTAGKDIPTLVAAGNYKAVVAALLEVGRAELRCSARKDCLSSINMKTVAARRWKNTWWKEHCMLPIRTVR